MYCAVATHPKIAAQKGRVTPSPRSPLFSVLFSSLKNGVRKTRPFLEGKIGKTQKNFSKIFIVPNRPKYHTDQLYTYKGYVDSVGFTEKRQKLSKWLIFVIFDLFQANKLTFNDTMTGFYDCMSTVEGDRDL